MLPLQIGEIALACKGEAHGEAQVTSVCIDSRKISQGCLFIAIKGDRFDGHDFVEKAFEEGAAAVMVHRDIHCRGPYVRVANTREALLRLAGYYRQFFQIPVVGLSGSVGKTTTKEMTAAVLSKRYKTLKNEGNLNNEIGMPMTAFGLDLGYGAAVFEMGMSGFGEIARMARAAAPTVGIITNIGVSHMEQLGSRENIRKAKLELLDGMDEYAPLILNGDDALLAGAQIKGRPVFYYGIEEERCRIRAQKITQSDRELSFTINYGYGSVSVQMPVVGMHFVYDALAAFTAGLILGIAPQAAAQALGEYEPAGMRQRVRQANGVTILEDCYNASRIPCARPFGRFGCWMLSATSLCWAICWSSVRSPGRRTRKLEHLRRRRALRFFLPVGPNQPGWRRQLTRRALHSAFMRLTKMGCWKSCCARSSRVTPCFSKRAAACGSRS